MYSVATLNVLGPILNIDRPMFFVTSDSLLRTRPYDAAVQLRVVTAGIGEVSDIRPLNLCRIEPDTRINPGRQVSEWKGFTLSPRSYQTIKRHVPFEQGKIAKALTPELTRLQRLGEVIDRALNL